MILKFFIGFFILISLNTLIIASEILKDEQRLLDSMSFEELLNTDIATGFPIEEKLVPAITSIVTTAEIRKSGARTLHEVLEQIPGLHIYMSDIDSNSPKVSIRGLESGYNSQVLFLLDGVPLNDLQNGNPGYTFQMPTSIIHRIEVIRGPGSAIYGADAFSGVINIVSKKYDNIVDDVGIRYGSFNTWEAWTNQSYNLGEISMGISLSIMHSDGDDGRIVTDVSGTTGALDTRYDTGYLHADFSYKEMDVNLLIERSRDMGMGIGHKQNLDPQGYVNRDKILIDTHHTNKDWFKDTTLKTSLVLSYLQSDSHYNPFNDVVNSWNKGEPFTTEYIAGISTNVINDSFKNHKLNIKVGYEYGFLDPQHWRNFGPGTPNDPTQPAMVDISDNVDAAYMLEHSRQTIYGFIQDEYTMRYDLVLTAGLRYDYYDDFGSSTSPRLALVWQSSESMTMKIMYGRAFRAPTFGELYYINNPAVRGNEDLNPETIDTYELALNYRAKVHTKLNFFYYEAKDLIDYQELPGATLGEKTAQNLKDQNAYGVELELEYSPLSSLNARANYSYQHSEDANTKERIANVPVHQAFAQLQYEVSQNWSLNTEYFFIGKNYRESTDTRSNVSSSSVVNLTIEGREIFKGLDTLVSIRNIFDEKYNEPSNIIEDDYPMQGRYIFSEVRYRF